MSALEIRSMLVVDDDEDYLRVLETSLKSLGVEIVTCIDPLQALDLMTQRSFDAILSDFKMPRMTGLEMLTSMKVLDIDVPVVFLTGLKDFEIAVEALRLGAVDFIHKPASIGEITDKSLKAIEMGVRRKRLQLAYERNQQQPNSQNTIEIERQKRMLTLLQLKNAKSKTKAV